ncbi:MAG: ribonuclease HI family protein [Halobacteria archaeon]|nr:ribonuclease HI family protein [Halobacteria archaeon]
MGKVVEVAPEEARDILEKIGAEFTDGEGDERWRARHGGGVVACHDNGVVLYGNIEKLESLIRDSKEGELESGNEITVYFDGASRGNPGESAVAYVIVDGETVVKKHAEEIDEGTNNEAEYKALLKALETAHKLGYSNVEAVGDSQLVVKQVAGKWSCNADNLRPLLDEVNDITDKFDEFEIRHVPREANSEADKLANEALNDNDGR